MRSIRIRGSRKNTMRRYEVKVIVTAMNDAPPSIAENITGCYIGLGIDWKTRKALSGGSVRVKSVKRIKVKKPLW